MLGVRSLINVVAVVGIVVALAAVGHADDKKYTVADLKALIGQNAFKEAVQHLGDIAPSQRNAEWLDIAAAASGGVLGTVDTQDGTTLVLIDNIDRSYPQLLRVAKYTRPRAELGLKGMEGCFVVTDDYWSSNGRDNCIKFGLRFVDNSNGDRALALKVAKVVRRNTNAENAVQFFKRALDPKDTAACKDADLKLAVVAGLAMPPEYPAATESKAIMVACWDPLKDAVMAAFESDSKGGYVRQNTCDFLVAKQLVTGLNAKQCSKK